YKSAAEKVGPDQELADRMWRVTVDGSLLDAMPPGMAFSKKKIGASVIFPGRVTSFNPEDKYEALKTGGDRSAGFQLLSAIDDTVTQSTQPEFMSGSPGGRQTTAYERAKDEANAKTKLGLFGKMIVEGVREFGDLMIDIILTHQTTADVME